MVHRNFVALFLVSSGVLTASSLAPVIQSLKSIGGSLADVAQEELALSQPSSDPNPMQQVLFSDEVVQSYGSRCLDGSASGYYIRENKQSTQWVVYLQGGGLCVEPADCLERSKQNLGSSKNWAPNHTDGNNVLSTGDWNPLKDWNHVYVPYGSGDVWTGQMKEKTEDGLYFAGHNTVNAVLDHLTNTTSFPKATFLLLSGGSAGGIGTFHNADFVSSRAKVLAPAAVVKASPQAGFYFPSERVTLYPEFTENLTTPFAPVAAAYLSDFFHGPYLDASCTEAHRLDPHQCWSQAVHYPHVQTPLLVAQNRFDQNQIGSVLGVDWWPLKDKAEAYKEYFGKLMENTAFKMILASPKNDGLFGVSCYQHTDNLCMKGGSLVQNISYAAVLGDWVAGTNKVPHRLVDSCGDAPCNPKCDAVC